jgi:hypothetical protein
MVNISPAPHIALQGNDLPQGFVLSVTPSAVEMNIIVDILDKETLLMCMNDFVIYYSR